MLGGHGSAITKIIWGALRPAPLAGWRSTDSGEGRGLAQHSCPFLWFCWALPFVVFHRLGHATKPPAKALTGVPLPSYSASALGCNRLVPAPFRAPRSKHGPLRCFPPTRS